MMRYNTDGSGYIANYALVGDVENGQMYDGELPDDFARHARAYRVLDGVLTLDSARAAALDAQAAEVEPADSTEALLLEMAGDHEYRLCLIELGVNEL